MKDRAPDIRMCIDKGRVSVYIYRYVFVYIYIYTCMYRYEIMWAYHPPLGTCTRQDGSPPKFPEFFAWPRHVFPERQAKLAPPV